MQKDGETQAVDRSQDAVVGLLPIALIPIPPAIFAANAKAVEEGHLTIGHGIVTALFLLAVIAATTIAILIVRWSLNLANKANPGVHPSPDASAGVGGATRCCGSYSEAEKKIEKGC